MTDYPYSLRRNSAAGKDFRKRLKAFKKTIGTNIERIRKAQGIPLRTLARKTGFSAVKLDYWEMGRMNIDLIAIIRIAKILKVPHEQLLAIPVTGRVASEETAPETISETDTRTPEDDKPEDVPKGIDDILLMRLLDEPEVRQVREVLAREQQAGGYPDADTVRTMENPVGDVFELSLLFSDLVTGMPGDVPFHRRGLAWLAASLRRDAKRLHRLYHGKPPCYE